jgi:hypothetical protein
MPSEANKYHTYAQECFRLAEEANSTERRDKLLELASVWTDAAIREELAADRRTRNMVPIDKSGRH